jgi:hypothetical protein
VDRDGANPTTAARLPGCDGTALTVEPGTPLTVEPRAASDLDAARAVIRPSVSRRALWVEGVSVVALAGMVFVVHPVGFILHHPYWADEGWVALLSKAPLSQYVSLSSITPIGWLLLLRWSPFGRDGLRMVPLLFAGGSVAMAYLVVRNLPWKTASAARFAGLVSAALVLLAPIALVRNDLKQYTSDAFFALVVVALAGSVEANPSRRTLARLVCGAVVAIFFSTTSAFVTGAVFGGLVVAALSSRSTRWIRDVLVAGATTFALFALYFKAVILPHDNPAVRAYWRSYYLHGNLHHVFAVAWHRLGRLSPNLLAPEGVLVALFALGVIFIAGLGRRALAIAAPLLWLEMIIAGDQQRYPFLDQRTSHFLILFSLTVVGVGVSGVIIAVASRRRVVGVLLTIGVAIVVWYQASPCIDSHSIPNEDVRSQAVYVAHHRTAGDVVLVSLESTYAFAYYWPGAKTVYYVDHTGQIGNGYYPRVSNVTNVVYATGRTTQGTTDAMRAALALAARGGGPRRIWLIRSHLGKLEIRAWADTFRTLALQPHKMNVGPEALLFVTTTR